MDVQCELSRAQELESSDRIDEAIDTYTKILERIPDCVEAWRERGKLYFTRQNNFNDALDDLEKFISLRPNDPNAYSDRAYLYRYVYFESGKDDLLNLAIDDFTRAIELGETDADWREYHLDDTYFTRGTCYLDLHDYARAADDFQRYPEDEASSSVFECLARAFIGLREYTNALHAANQAIAMGDVQADMFALRAEIHRMLGDLLASESDLQRAQDLGKV